MPGYTADILVVAGTMGHDDIHVIVTYHPNTYNLTIRYVDSKGNEVHENYHAQVKYNEVYDVLSPKVGNMVPNIKRVTGNMPAHDVFVTVIYTLPAEFIIIDDFGIPLGISTGLNVGESYE